MLAYLFKTIIAFWGIVCYSHIFLLGQIAVQGNGNEEFFVSLDSAMANAQSGDTIYLPGGVYSINGSNTWVIDKLLHIYGVGHHPDSTSATGPTHINESEVRILSGANGGSLQGIRINGNVFFGDASGVNPIVNNFEISRCYIQGSLNLVFSTGNANANVSNNTVRENIIIGNFWAGDSFSQNNIISNNFIGGNVNRWGDNNFFSNNIFLSSSIQSISGSTFENNIFPSNISRNNITNCIFNNNLSVGNFIVPGGSIGSGNISHQPLSSIFINFQLSIGYQYFFDLHLQATSPGVSAGTDGNDIGIYGGLFPFKDGSIPNNPHIRFKSIAPTTDLNGNLLINIKVEAQNN